MEKGIITPTTKERMEELEAEKSELSIKIMKEEMSQPKLSREEILYWFYKFRKLNPKKLDHRRSLHQYPVLSDGVFFFAEQTFRSRAARRRFLSLKFRLGNTEQHVSVF